MSVDKFSEAWTEGFAKEAMAIGLDQEGASELLKFAALLNKQDDPKFIEGFEGEVQGIAKDAQNAGARLGSALWNTAGKFLKHPVGAAATALSVPAAAGAGYLGLWRPYVGKGKFEREAQGIRDAAELGFIDEHQLANALNTLRRRLAEQSVAGTGAKIAPANSGGNYWSPWY